MRSRYTAFVLGFEDYLLATWHPRTRSHELNLAQSPSRWLGLQVLRHDAGTADSAIVEFIARYEAGPRERTPRNEPVCP
jgi:SEC-C motif-containing protein